MPTNSDDENPEPEKTPKPESLPTDMLRGADSIAEFLFGDKKYRKKVIYLCEQGRLNGQLPARNDNDP